MITVLGEFVRPNGGAAWTQTLIDAMDLLGVQSKTTRQVLARLSDRGWLDRTKQGRRTRWHLTALSEPLLKSGAERIYGFGQSPNDWDERWLVLLASLPERDQALRYRLTTGLNWAGFGSLGQGIWISPWTGHEADAVSVVHDAGVEGATSFVAEVGQLGDGAELAARAWDLGSVREHYDEFLEMASGLAPVTTDIDAVKQLTMLVHRWRRFPFLDPELPAALLPADWPGGDAVDEFRSRRDALTPVTARWWAGTEARYEPTVA